MHHAYLLLGTRESAEGYLGNTMREWDEATVGNPDCLTLKYETLGIEEARELAVFASRRAYGKRKIFFLLPESMTLEAQNALLKTFEDPTPNTHFFLSLREESLAIPTLRSRMMSVRLASNTVDVGEDVNNFIELPLAERLKFSKEFEEKELNLAVFLDNLLLFYKKSGSVTNLRRVYNARRFASDRSASARLISEHLALVLD